MQRLIIVFLFSVVIVVTCVPRVAIAQRGFMQMFEDNVGKLIPIFSYGFTGYPSADVSNQSTELSVYKQDVSLFVPLWQNEHNDVSFTNMLEVRSNHARAVLPATGTPLPETLWDVRFGPNYRHRFGNGWILGGNILFGSASDEPFKGYRELELMGSLFLRVPEDNGDAWLGFLNYSNNRDFLNNIPIGGFGYWFGSVDWFEGLVGIPLISVTFLPKNKVNLHYTYYPLLNMHAGVTCSPMRWISFYGRFDWDNERYFLPTRTDKRARLFNYEKRVAAGITMRAARWFSIDLMGGYAFDRFYFEGRSYSDRNDNRIDVANVPFVKAQLNVLMFPKSARGGRP